jgi:hypothetical protein
MPPKKSKVKPITITPTLNDQGKWEWEGVRAFKLPDGLGVFATQDLPMGSRFEYFGKPLTKEQFDDLVEAEKKKKTPRRLAYIVQLSADSYLDAYHKHQLGVSGKGKNLGGCVNEPEKSKDANCKLVVSSSKGSRHAWIVTKRDIQKDEELKMNYGGKYKRAGYSKS